MSHFSLMVIADKDDDIEDLMAPYQEEAEPEFNEFDDREDEFMEEYKVTILDGEHIKKSNPKILGKKAKDVFNFEEFVEFYHGLDSRDADNNRFGYWCNPNAQWDWYELGGRWSGQLIINPIFSKTIKNSCRQLSASKRQLGFRQG